MNAPNLTGAAGDKHNDLTWTAVPGATKYRLRRATGSGGYGALYTGGALTFANTGLTNGTVYHYRVRGVDSKGKNGPWSNTVDLTPAGVVVPPPTGLTVYGYGAPAYSALWDKVKNLTPINVSSWAALKSAVDQTGPRLIRVSGTFSGGGQVITITKPDCFIDFAGSGIDSGWFKIATSRVVMLQPRIWLGDDVSAPDDADPITINGGGSTPDGIAIIGGSLLFGPDIGGIAILNGAKNITVQDSILGCGLYLSRHFEGTPALNGHSKGANLTQIGTAVSSDATPRGDRISFIRNLIGFSDDRNPQIHGGSNLDWYQNVIYLIEGSNAPDGNPRSLNFEGNWIISESGSPSNRPVFESTTNKSNPRLHTGSVYEAANMAIGMGPAKLGAGVRVSSPFPNGGRPTNALSMGQVLAGVGPASRHPFEDILLNHVTARTSDGFYNGSGGPEPRWHKP